MKSKRLLLLLPMRCLESSMEGEHGARTGGLCWHQCSRAQQDSSLGQGARSGKGDMASKVPMSP